MVSTARSIIGVSLLGIGCLLGIGARSAQAQASSYFSPVPACSYPVPAYSSPAQRYYYPAPPYPYAAQGYTQPAGRSIDSYSYYDANGIEHDSRYPHWSFDFDLWLNFRTFFRGTVC